MLCPQLVGESSDLYVTSAEIEHHTLDSPVENDRLRW